MLSLVECGDDLQPRSPSGTSRRVGNWIYCAAKWSGSQPECLVRLFSSVCSPHECTPSDCYSNNYARMPRINQASALGVGTMTVETPRETERSLHTLMTCWKDFLDLRSNPAKGKPWKRVLKDRFNAQEHVGLDHFARATEGNFTNAEGHRLFAHWSEDGHTVALAAVIAGLEGTIIKERATFAHYNKGASLDPVPRREVSRSNIESDSSPHKNGGVNSPYAAAVYDPQSVDHRPLTAAQPAVPAKKDDRKAGLTLVESVPAHPSCSSVEGGIFSRKFTHAGEDSGPNDPLGGNKSNLPSLQGGIFEDHSNDPVLPSPRSQNRSQLSSVPGGIFAPLPRPDTVEYGSERYKDGFTIGGARPF